MNEEEKLILRGLIEECVCQKIEKQNDRLDAIDKKLGNHFEHLTADYNSLTLKFTELNTNYDWIKKLFDNKCVAPDGSLKDKINDAFINGKQEANIDWNNWFVRLVIGVLITNIIGMILIGAKLLISAN